MAIWYTVLAQIKLEIAPTSRTRRWTTPCGWQSRWRRLRDFAGWVGWQGSNNKKKKRIYIRTANKSKSV